MEEIRIQIKRSVGSVATQNGAYHTGRIYSLPSAKALKLVERGYADLVDAQPVEQRPARGRPRKNA